MPKLNNQQEEVVKLANKKGDDADLFLLDKIQETDQKIDKVEENLTQKFDKTIEDVKQNVPDLNKVLDSVRGKDGIQGIQGEQGPKGEKGDKGEQGFEGRQGPRGEKGLRGDKGEKGDKGDKGIDGKNGNDGSPDTPEQVRDKLETLKGEDRLDKSAIKGLEEGIIDKGITLVGGGRGIQLYVDGTKKGLIKTINLIPGSGITITHTLSYGRNDILIDATGGAGFTKLDATGAVNGVNTTFTFIEKPTYIIQDGAWYQENKGWAWTGATLTATMDIPPSNDIYGFK